MEAVLLKKWESVASRFHELTDQLMDPSVVGQPAQLRKLSKERTELEPAVELLQTYQDISKQLEEAAQILADPTAGPELHRMAMEETAALERRQSELEAQAKEFLIPKDPKDEKNLVLEIRAGTGGEEAALAHSLRAPSSRRRPSRTGRSPRGGHRPAPRRRASGCRRPPSPAPTRPAGRPPALRGTQRPAARGSRR